MMYKTRSSIRLGSNRRRQESIWDFKNYSMKFFSSNHHKLTNWVSFNKPGIVFRYPVFIMRWDEPDDVVVVRVMVTAWLIFVMFNLCASCKYVEIDVYREKNVSSFLFLKSFSNAQKNVQEYSLLEWNKIVIYRIA